MSIVHLKKKANQNSFGWCVPEYGQSVHIWIEFKQSLIPVLKMQLCQLVARDIFQEAFCLQFFCGAAEALSEL